MSVRVECRVCNGSSANVAIECPTCRSIMDLKWPPDPRDATIRELRAVCGEGALAMQDQADALMERGLTYRYEMDLAAKFRAASAAPALAEPAKRLRKELGK